MAVPTDEKPGTGAGDLIQERGGVEASVGQHGAERGGDQRSGAALDDNEQTQQRVSEFPMVIRGVGFGAVSDGPGVIRTARLLARRLRDSMHRGAWVVTELRCSPWPGWNLYEFIDEPPGRSA